MCSNKLFNDSVITIVPEGIMYDIKSINSPIDFFRNASILMMIDLEFVSESNVYIILLRLDLEEIIQPNNKITPPIIRIFCHSGSFLINSITCEYTLVILDIVIFNTCFILSNIFIKNAKIISFKKFTPVGIDSLNKKFDIVWPRPRGVSF